MMAASTAGTFLRILRSARSLVASETALRWIRESESEGGWRGFLLLQAGIFSLTIRTMDNDLGMRAAALTYRSLLALVPLLAVAFAAFGAFGNMEELREPLVGWIFDTLAMRSDEARATVSEFLSNINAGAIAGVGALGVLYTAVGLLISIESSFNRIWGIRKNRPFLTGVGRNWAFITLVPLLVAYSLSLSSSLESYKVATVVLRWLPFGLGAVLLSLTTVVAVCAALTLAYIVIPNTEVSVKPALVGGVIAGVLWSTLKSIFILTVASSVRYSAIYGTLSVLPILMVWMYLSWLAVLFGARFVQANQTLSVHSPSLTPWAVSFENQERLAMHIVYEVGAAFRARKSAPNQELLARWLGAPMPVVRHLVDVLAEQRIIAPKSAGGDGVEGYIPGVPFEDVTPAEVITCLARWNEAHVEPRAEGTYGELDELLVRSREASSKVLASITLAELVAREDAGEPREGDDDERVVGADGAA